VIQGSRIALRGSEARRVAIFEIEASQSPDAVGVTAKSIGYATAGP
jgi:hypothetical protein